MISVNIQEGFDKMDFVKITAMLAESYWTPGIKQAEVEQGAINSTKVIGVFFGDTQIGYARVVSDKTRFAYILDVYVDENYRKQGIGQKMINFLLSHPDLKDVYMWLLITKDAHGVYDKCGFKPLSFSERWMEIRKKRS